MALGLWKEDEGSTLNLLTACAVSCRLHDGKDVPLREEESSLEAEIAQLSTTVGGYPSDSPCLLGECRRERRAYM